MTGSSGTRLTPDRHGDSALDGSRLQGDDFGRADRSRLRHFRRSWRTGSSICEGHQGRSRLAVGSNFDERDPGPNPRFRVETERCGALLGRAVRGRDHRPHPRSPFPVQGAEGHRPASPAKPSEMPVLQFRDAVSGTILRPRPRPRIRSLESLIVASPERPNNKGDPSDYQQFGEERYRLAGQENKGVRDDQKYTEPHREDAHPHPQD